MDEAISTPIGESNDDFTSVTSGDENQNPAGCFEECLLGTEHDSSFAALNKEINQSDEFNLTHDYKFNESTDSLIAREGLKLNQNNLVINGNGHVIDGAGIGALFHFKNLSGKIIINDLTFKNFAQTVLNSYGGLTLNNVNFTGFINPDNEMIHPKNLIVDNCLSENYVSNLQLKYYNAGDLRISATGFSYSGLGYSLSWYGVLPTDAQYDDRGYITEAEMDIERIHVQDAAFIYTGGDDTTDQLKRAILKYGAVTIQCWVSEPEKEIPTEGEDIAIEDHNAHFVSLIGWDDNEGGSLIKGAWIAKDSSIGISTILFYTNFSDFDYYVIVPQRVAVAYIFENTIDYHVNYQTDITGLTGFNANYTSYSNEFTSKYDELIGAVGTYFNESGINYSFDVFVNGVKTYTQSGVSEFAGFRTIVLDKYVQIKAGDQFKVVFKSNSVPYQAFSRLHYKEGMSFI